MTAPMIDAHADPIYQLTLPLPRLRALLLRELGDHAAAAEPSEEAIAEIEDALARLDAGEYGACERCGTSIPIERLVAHPQTSRCLECTTASLR